MRASTLKKWEWLSQVVPRRTRPLPRRPAISLESWNWRCGLHHRAGGTHSPCVRPSRNYCTCLRPYGRSEPKLSCQCGADAPCASASAREQSSPFKGAGQWPVHASVPCGLVPERGESNANNPRRVEPAFFRFAFRYSPLITEIFSIICMFKFLIIRTLAYWKNPTPVHYRNHWVLQIK